MIGKTNPLNVYNSRKQNYSFRVQVLKHIAFKKHTPSICPPCKREWPCSEAFSCVSPAGKDTISKITLSKEFLSQEVSS